MDTEPNEPHRRRERYKGTHPRTFAQKYKELNPERYPEDVKKVLSRGDTPAGTHRSICVAEVLEVLSPKPGETAIDCTLGYGGHSLEILRAITPGGRLYGLDRDPLEIARTEERLRAEGFPPETFCPHLLNFADVSSFLAREKIPGVDMILADLGVSSMQIDNPERGFTFKREGPLDMRMDPTKGVSAAEFLLTVSEKRLAEIIEEYSDETEGPYIAHVLTQRRGTITTTTALADAIRDTLRPRMNSDEENQKIIRRTFQALRIEVNGEFLALDSLLAALPAALKRGGRVALLCFHSGEGERIEKSFAEGRENGIYEAVSGEPIRASSLERHQNPRSSSARLWWAVRA